MSKVNSFIENFRNDHSQLQGLTNSFKETVEAGDAFKAKEIISKIDEITKAHFSFEEEYLYPRLRRLMREITERLSSEQQVMKNFIREAKSAIEDNRMGKNEASNIMDMLPKLSKTFKDCDDLVFLIEKFDTDEKENLYQRFKEFHQMREKVVV